MGLAEWQARGSTSPPGGNLVDGLPPAPVVAAAGSQPQILEIRADSGLAGSLLEKSLRNPQDGGGQRRLGRGSAVGARFGGHSDLYEPHVLQEEMSGNTEMARR